ncbi:MAG: adenosylcobinamide-GDP ribazoletransferase, partial [Pseudomonadota bacterium]
MRGLIAAFQFLTRLPMPTLVGYSEADTRDAAHWYTTVGIVVGVLVAFAMLAGLFAASSSGNAAGQMSPWVGGLCGLAVWVIVTGALHLDGVADTADGLAAAHGDPDRFTQVAREPQVGAFALVAVLLLLLAKLVLLAALLARGIGGAAVGEGVGEVLAGVALVPAWARLGPLVWRAFVPPLGTGRGQAFAATHAPAPLWINAIGLSIGAVFIAPVLLVGAVLIHKGAGACVAAKAWPRPVPSGGTNARQTSGPSRAH